MTEPEQPELLITKKSATFLVPPGMLAQFEMNDVLGQVLRGEIQLKPPPEPHRHRCLACWFVSLLPGHDRCTHGRLMCDDCSDY